MSSYSLSTPTFNWYFFSSRLAAPLPLLNLSHPHASPGHCASPHSQGHQSHHQVPGLCVLPLFPKAMTCLEPIKSSQLQLWVTTQGLARRISHVLNVCTGNSRCEDTTNFLTLLPTLDSVPYLAAGGLSAQGHRSTAAGQSSADCGEGRRPLQLPSPTSTAMHLQWNPGCLHRQNSPSRSSSLSSVSSPPLLLSSPPLLLFPLFLFVLLIFLRVAVLFAFIDFTKSTPCRSERCSHPCHLALSSISIAKTTLHCFLPVT